VSYVLLALSGFFLTVLAVVMIGIALSSDFEVEIYPGTLSNPWIYSLMQRWPQMLCSWPGLSIPLFRQKRG
jgi:succinate dehydrogenase hydrophobic anchor subunit